VFKKHKSSLNTTSTNDANTAKEPKTGKMTSETSNENEISSLN
jgi:hypothetical protein